MLFLAQLMSSSYSIRDSFSFAKEVTSFDLRHFKTSFDNNPFFTNKPVEKQFCVKKIKQKKTTKKTKKRKKVCVNTLFRCCNYSNLGLIFQF